MDTLTGSVERITYYNPENGYSILRLKAEEGAPLGGGREQLVTVTGNLPEVTPGETLRLLGEWRRHPKHGLQFHTQECEQVWPASVEGIRRYLGSGLIKGIGEKLARGIVNTFGAHTIQVIEKEPQRLLEVPDIGRKRMRLIAQAWDQQKIVKEIMLFLHSQGISTNLAVKIHKHYGDQALQVVKSEPYRLAREIYGVGFRTADGIAQGMGLAKDHPARLESGILHVIHEKTEEGHLFLPAKLLQSESSHLLEVNEELILPAVERLVAAKALVRDHIPEKVFPNQKHRPAGQDTEIYYLAVYYASETGLAVKLLALASAIPTRLADIPPALLTLEPALTPEQQAAIRKALGVPVSVLCGGPGTGKTTCLRNLITILDQAHKSYALASPTGRAARRLSEATGRPAATLHRLLGYTPDAGFTYHEKRPLDVDMLVVDEASMLDIQLATSLVKALPLGCHLLLVGDADQLPSVGAGDVLRDVIRSAAVPVTRLNLIFRQQAGSSIITNAHRINQGQMPEFVKRTEENQADFFLFPAESGEEAAGWVEEVVSQRIPRTFGYDATRQVQVLAPIYRGPAGINDLNSRLQSKLNPSGSNKVEKVLSGQLFRMGDKVMQVRNNYDKEVFNGDIGWITDINLTNNTLGVEFEARRLEYEWGEADQLVLAYAISIHKSQGSEFPVVVVPLITAHYMLLQRNLLYTAVTRAKKLCVLVGSQKAIGMAVRNNSVAQRYSALAWRLNLTNGKSGPDKF